MRTKETLCVGTGIVGSLVAAQFGGWDVSLQALVAFMAVDYLTGLLVAGVFHTSEKTPTGTLESRAGWKGLVRKGVSLLVVFIGAQLDRLTGASFIRDGVVIAFLLNELISIVENMGLMGIPVPKAMVNAIDVLKQREDQTT